MKIQTKRNAVIPDYKEIILQNIAKLNNAYQYFRPTDQKIEIFQYDNSFYVFSKIFKRTQDQRTINANCHLQCNSSDIQRHSNTTLVLADANKNINAITKPYTNFSRYRQNVFQLWNSFLSSIATNYEK